MQGAGFFVAFFALLVLLAIVTADGGEVFRVESMRERSDSGEIESRT